MPGSGTGGASGAASTRASPSALVQARRESLLAAEPARKAEAERQLARARVAHKLKNADAAAAAFEAALRADPLDLAAHEAFVAFEAGRGT